MNALYIMVPIALLLGALFVGIFIWATQNGQFDDLDTPPERLLLEDENEMNINNKINFSKKER